MVGAWEMFIVWETVKKIWGGIIGEDDENENDDYDNDIEWKWNYWIHKNYIVVIVIIEIMTYTHKRLINVFASNNLTHGEKSFSSILC